MIQRLRQAFARLADPNRGLLLPVLGFPVRIHPTFWLVALVVALQARDHQAALVVLVPALLVSILVHELGHVLAASRWGAVYRITIHGGGGLTEWRFVGRTSWRKTVAVSLAGPGAGFLLAGLAWAAQRIPHSSPWLWLATSALLWLNLVWGLFNLLPIYPLDGGQALRAILIERTPATGERLSAIVSLATALPAAVVAIALEQPWALLILGLFAFRNGTTLAAYRASRGKTDWRTLGVRDRVRDRY